MKTMKEKYPGLEQGICEFRNEINDLRITLEDRSDVGKCQRLDEIESEYLLKFSDDPTNLLGLVERLSEELWQLIDELDHELSCEASGRQMPFQKGKSSFCLSERDPFHEFRSVG